MDNTDSKTGTKYLGLTANQRKLLYGEKPFQRSVQLERIIDKKLRRLPKRLDDLLTDIDAFNEAHFFESDWEPPLSDAMKQNNQDMWEAYDWESIHREILDDDGIAGIISDDDAIGQLDPSPDGKIRQVNKNARAENFGNSLGIAIHQLTHDSMSHDERAQLLIGFFKGLLMGKDGPPDYQTGNQAVTSAMDAIEDIFWQFKFQAPTTDIGVGRKDYRETEDREVAKKVINNSGLLDTDVLTEYIIDEAFQFPIRRDHLTDSNYTTREYGLVNDEDPLPEYENKSVEEKKSLRGKLIVGLVERNTNIKTMEKLIKYVEVATVWLKHNENKSAVFEELYKNHADPKKYDIDKIISSPKLHMDNWGPNTNDWGSNKGIVFTLAGTKGELSVTNEVSITGDISDIELLIRNSEGEWNMAPLGELVAYIYIDKNNDYPVDELCHKYALNKDVTDEEKQLIRATIPTFDEINNTELREERSAQS